MSIVWEGLERSKVKKYLVNLSLFYESFSACMTIFPVISTIIKFLGAFEI